MTESASATQADRELAGFGYKQELGRTLHRRASFAVAFSTISVTAGTVQSYGLILAIAGPLGFLTWGLAALGFVTVALVYGFLSSRAPITGLSYQWGSRFINPIVGGAMGWVDCGLLLIASVATDYALAQTILPALFGYAATPNSIWVGCAVVLALQSLLIAYSTVIMARINSAAVATEIAGVLGLVLLLVIIGAIRGDLHAGQVFSHGAVPTSGYFSLGGARSVGPFFLLVSIACFSLAGFEAAANVVEETHDPRHTVPRSMLMGIVSAGVLSLLMFAAVNLTGTNLDKIAGSATPVPDVVRQVMGGFMAKIVEIVLAFSFFAAGMMVLLYLIRYVWAMARDERFPGYQGLRKVHPTYHTPFIAAVTCGLLAEILLAAFAHRQDALLNLLTAGGLAVVVHYLFGIGIFFAVRRRIPAHGKFNLGRWELPIACAALAWLLFAIATFRDKSYSTPWEYFGVVVAAGILYFAWLFIFKRDTLRKMPLVMTLPEDSVGTSADIPQQQTTSTPTLTQP